MKKIALILLLIFFLSIPALGQDLPGSLIERLRAQGPQLERQVLSLARMAVRSLVASGKIPAAPQDSDHPALASLLRERAGVFITLISHNSVRGCVGSLRPQWDSIASEIVNNAVLAASADLRHPPIREDELDSLQYSVAIVEGVERIDPGVQLDPREFGVAIISIPDGRVGVILPGEALTWSYAVRWAMRNAGITAGKSFVMEKIKAITFGAKLPIYRK